MGQPLDRAVYTFWIGERLLAQAIGTSVSDATISVENSIRLGITPPDVHYYLYDAEVRVYPLHENMACEEYRYDFWFSDRFIATAIARSLHFARIAVFGKDSNDLPYNTVRLAPAPA